MVFFQWALMPPQAVEQTFIFSRSHPGEMIREANVFTGRMTADGMQETTRVIFNITTITTDLISITATIADTASLNETTMICVFGRRKFPSSVIGVAQVAPLSKDQEIRA